MQRRTRQRDAICRAFQRAARPLSPHEVLGLAQVEVPAMGIATVYRAIRDLAEEEWLQAVELPGEPARYERRGLGHHHHFVCRGCDRVFEVEGCPGPSSAEVPEGFMLEDHEVIYYGRCPECAARH